MVFIVDQSWAMSAPGTQEAVDPLDQRKFAVDAMIDLLTGLALDQCPGTNHRISVISYGSSVRTNLKMYSISPETAEEANELRDENGIKKSVVADNLGSDNNPEAAFAEAAKIWRTTPAIDDKDGINRKKVIIFLTNGISKNSPGDYAKSTEVVKNQVNGLFPFDGNLLKLEACLSKLRKRVRMDMCLQREASVCMADYPVDQEAYNNSTYIWTVFLKPPGYEKYGQAYEGMISHYDEMSETHGGDAIELKANSRKDVPSTFRNILSYLAGVRPVLLNCGEFAMNPYLREARLTVYKIDPDIKITLAYKDQDGVQHSLLEGNSSSLEAFNVKDYYSFGANEAYILSYPYGGIWQLTADNCQGLDTYYEQVDIDTSQNLSIPDLIPQYEVEPFYDPEHPQPLVYEMHDKTTGNLISQASHPRFVVSTTATVTSPAGDIKEYTLNWDNAKQSFVSTEPLQVSVSGIYGVHVVGTTYTHEGSPSPLNTVVPDLVFDKPYTLFDLETQFEVAPVTPFTIEIVNPPLGISKNVHATAFDRWPPLDVAPLPISIRLLDRDGNMLINPEEYLKSTQDVFTAHVEGEGQTSTEIKLQPDANNPGYFTGEIVDFEVVGGEQKVIVVMDESAMLKDRRPYNREVRSDFSRLDDLFHTPAFWQFLLIAFIIWVIVSIVVYFAVRTNKVSGTLVFQDGSALLAEFNCKRQELAGNWAT
ncbi:vWA domain-containing protein [Candidatus Villigracilis affinis]|uniref:vWA domain-containing protein n=1 Tax=Candidatus Villigracilis affinis TaxID=3140682 RepID=UPI002A1E567C|nr:VWA domain-containing protein [Anaerolineales bacterium]